MNERQPSQTALGAAGYRAAHQILEGGKVFSDPLARTILGDGADAIIAGLSEGPAQQRTRIYMAVRSRFAEDCLGAAVSRGVRQAVVLGAGFDTFALRNPYSELGLRVFEVDHAATQAWKRRRLSEVGLAIPASLTFAAVDFESDDLGRGLRDAGLNPDDPAFFIWLGCRSFMDSPFAWKTRPHRSARAEINHDPSATTSHCAEAFEWMREPFGFGKLAKQDRKSNS